MAFREKGAWFVRIFYGFFVYVFYFFDFYNSFRSCVFDVYL